MKIKKIYGLACVVGFLLTASVAAAQDNPEEILKSVSQELVDAAAPVNHITDSWRSSLQRFRVPEGTTLNENGITPLGNDKIISTVSISPNVTMGQAGWVSSRIAAFERAELQAKYEIVKYLAQTMASETGLDAYEKSAFTDGEIEEVKALSRYQRMLDKGGELIESVLDNALIGLNEDYDPEQYSVEEKHITFSDTLATKQAGFAARMVTGAMTVYSGEGFDEDSDTYIMIVSLLHTPKLELLARNMSNQDYNMPAMEAGIPVSKMIPGDKKKLIANLGVRVVVDERGEYTVIAFGQSQPRKTSSARQHSAINTAQKKANNKARGYLVSFIQANVRGKDDSETEETVREFDDGSYGVSNIDDFRQTIKSISKPVKLVGLRTVKSWDARHPQTGQLVVGSIVSWSPAQQRSANELNNALSNTKKSESQTEKKSADSEAEKMNALDSMDVNIDAF